MNGENPESAFTCGSRPPCSGWEGRKGRSLCEITPIHRDRRPQHVYQCNFVNLGDPLVGHKGWWPFSVEAEDAQSREVRLRHSIVEASNDRGEKGVAERNNCK